MSLVVGGDSGAQLINLSLEVGEACDERAAGKREGCVRNGGRDIGSVGCLRGAAGVRRIRRAGGVGSIRGVRGVIAIDHDGRQGSRLAEASVLSGSAPATGDNLADTPGQYATRARVGREVRMVDVVLAVSLPQFDGCDHDGLLAIDDLLAGAIIKASKRPRSKAGLQPYLP
ncbi:hypothetical protein B0H65DRAFT_471420 [Neurospora tetraspora]|uniref:Uncharacterized protein n=1 Tax=Neurospora tetraspora TaxID=94610 RepID=A0AAE0MP03_9PEZI|nr:hypothetical protein B0H65DRAFT_471420 [Neurospora tetraspora]